MTATTSPIAADRAAQGPSTARCGRSGTTRRSPTELIPELGPELVAATCGVRPGDRVLDVAAGIRQRGRPGRRAPAPTVIASDLTPELFDAGRGSPPTSGVELEWEEADAEALPYPDGASTWCCPASGRCSRRTTSTAADELVRVCGPAAPSG